MNILCAGPHLAGLAPILGTTDSAVPPLMLCEDCGDIYIFTVSTKAVWPGALPDEDAIAKNLKALKPAADLSSYKPPKPPKP